MSASSESIIRQIKETVDIVSLVGQYVQIHRAGNRFKALCPFHDDKNPSMEVNPARQSFKCWSCGVGGDCIEFVQKYERVDFPEAIRILADRLGLQFEKQSPQNQAAKGPAKADIFQALSWAAGFYAEEFLKHTESQGYVAQRGLSPEIVSQFGLGYSPADSSIIKRQARTAGISEKMLEAAGVMASAEGRTYDRFHDRLMFPIYDLMGRVVGFGGRILPERDRAMAEAGKRVGKYVNSPETSVFQKRKLLYAADKARDAARAAKQVIVMEGYTDVMAAHQAGIRNVVGTLGTALGDEHIPALRQLADRIILVFDGDEAGLKAAERGLEIFLGQPVELALVALPDGLDPCDFLQREGAEAFAEIISRASDPLQFAIDRAEAKFDLQNPEQARQAADWALSIFARIPDQRGSGMDVKIAMALDRLAFRLKIPTGQLQQSWSGYRRDATKRSRTPKPVKEISPPQPTEELPDPLEREFVELLLNFPELVGQVHQTILASELKHPTLRMITQVLYDSHRAGEVPELNHISERLSPESMAMAAGLFNWIERGPLPENVLPADGHVRMAGVLQKFSRRSIKERVADLRLALTGVNSAEDPETYQALTNEIRRLLARGLPTLSPTIVSQN